MAGGPRSRPAAGLLLSRRFHRPGRDRADHIPEQGGRLRSAVQGGGRNADDHRRRSKTSRRPHRPHRRASHLGIGADPSSPCTHHHPRRRPVAGRLALDRLHAGLLPVGARAVACSGGCSSKASSRSTKAGRLAFFGGLSLADDAAFTAAFAPLRGCNWVVYASARSPGRRLCSPICRATPIAARYRTPGSSRWTTRASPSNGRTIGSTNRNEYKTMTLDPAEFIRRFLMHVLPSRSTASAITACSPARRAPATSSASARCLRSQSPRRNNSLKRMGAVGAADEARKCPCCGPR